MALFFEKVALQPGDTVSDVLDRYGIDSSRWGEVQQLGQNSHLPATAGMQSGPPQISFLCVPIDNFMMVVNYKVAKNTTTGLRPYNSSWTKAQIAAHAAACAHGVDINVERDGNPCVGLRWVQTVKKLHGTPFHGLMAPPEFVDSRVTGFPFYNGEHDPDSPDDLEFADTPCGPAPVRPRPGMDFHATVSLVVWTAPQVTVVSGYTYRFQIGPTGALWLIKPREATDAEYAEQVRILQAGVGETGNDSGKGLNYRKPPAPGSINQ